MDEPPDPGEAVETAAQEEKAGFPWPPPAGESLIVAFGRTWRASVFEPTRFFRDLPPGRALGAAFLYYLVVGVAATGVGLFWRSVLSLTTGAAVDSAFASMYPALAGWVDLVSFFFSPILLALWLALLACVLHASLWIVGGARSGLQRTFHALCFTNGPALFTIVPVLGAWVGAIWGLVLTVIALREAHRIETWRAVVALFLPLALLFVVGVALVLAGVFLGGLLLTGLWS